MSLDNITQNVSLHLTSSLGCHSWILHVRVCMCVWCIRWLEGCGRKGRAWSVCMCMYVCVRVCVWGPILLCIVHLVLWTCNFCLEVFLCAICKCSFRHSMSTLISTLFHFEWLNPSFLFLYFIYVWIYLINLTYHVEFCKMNIEYILLINLFPLPSHWTIVQNICI